MSSDVGASSESSSAMKPPMPRLTMIDGAHWLGVLALQGLVIGTMGL